MIKILYFGRLRENVGCREETLALPEDIATISALKQWLNTEHELDGALQDPSVKTMVNQTLVHGDVALSGDEEIGFLPPVGGG
ncbi:MAG: molybdopterin converting factor subunit 1 [Robiginitomaculum sp.]|nr:MAG: molybdopterin converting factor subunit 1 [Robiginitomaculum sp.]